MQTQCTVEANLGPVILCLACVVPVMNVCYIWSAKHGHIQGLNITEN